MIKICNKYLHSFIKAIAAGICISLGCIINLYIDNKYLGAFLFSIGLLAILSYKFNLYTGKIGFICDYPDVLYVIELFIIWIGNLIGTLLTAILISYTRIYHIIYDKAIVLTYNKMHDDILSLLILAIFCGICMYVAITQFVAEDKPTMKNCIVVILSIMVFILSGFEHCVADMFYFAIADRYVDFKILERLLIITAGNSIGSIVFALINRKQKQ